MLCAIAACGGGGGDASLVVDRRTAGDTTIVATRGSAGVEAAARLVLDRAVGAVGGGDSVEIAEVTAIALAPDGRVLVTDGDQPAIRVFDSLLRPLAIWSRSGAGPGELRNPDGGLTVLPDGRTVVRDPGNARFTVLGPSGAPVANWRVISGQRINRRPFWRTGDTLIASVLVDPTVPLSEWRDGLARIGPDGVVIDTLPLPPAMVTPPRLTARAGGNLAERDLPYAPASHWTWHPAGGIVTARGDQPAITWRRAEGLLRFGRERTPAPVTDGEREQARSAVTRALQWLDPSWRWEGPPIPDTKPYVSGLYTGADGRIWVLFEGAGILGEDPDYGPDDPDDVEERWRPVRFFDVFRPDGTFDVTVSVPPGLRFRPEPVFTGTGVWAQTRDADGAPQVAFYRVERAGGR